MGCHFLLQGIFPTQGSNPGLPHCRQPLYRLSHQGSPSHVQLFVTSWTATCQASLSFTVSQSLLKLMSIESVMPSTLCHPFSCPQSFSVQSFPVSQLFTLGGQSFGASASTSVLPVNIKDWFHLGLTGLISLLSKGFFIESSRKHQFFSSQPSLWSSCHIQNHSFD